MAVSLSSFHEILEVSQVIQLSTCSSFLVLIVLVTSNASKIIGNKAFEVIIDKSNRSGFLGRAHKRNRLVTRLTSVD